MLIGPILSSESEWKGVVLAVGVDSVASIAVSVPAVFCPMTLPDPSGRNDPSGTTVSAAAVCSISMPRAAATSSARALEQVLLRL